MATSILTGFLQQLLASRPVSSHFQEQQQSQCQPTDGRHRVGASCDDGNIRTSFFETEPAHDRTHHDSQPMFYAAFEIVTDPAPGHEPQSAQGAAVMLNGDGNDAPIKRVKRYDNAACDCAMPRPPQRSPSLDRKGHAKGFGFSKPRDWRNATSSRTLPPPAPKIMAPLALSNRWEARSGKLRSNANGMDADCGESDEDSLLSMKPPRLARHVTPPPPMPLPANMDCTSDIFAMMKDIRSRSSIVLDDDANETCDAAALPNQPTMASAVAIALSDLALFGDMDDSDDDDDDMLTSAATPIAQPSITQLNLMQGSRRKRQRNVSMNHGESGSLGGLTSTIKSCSPLSPVGETNSLAKMCKWELFQTEMHLDEENDDEVDHNEHNDVYSGFGNQDGSPRSLGYAQHDAYASSTEFSVTINDDDGGHHSQRSSNGSSNSKQRLLQKRLSPPVCPKKRMSDEDSALLHTTLQEAMLQVRKEFATTGTDQCSDDDFGPDHSDQDTEQTDSSSSCLFSAIVR